MDRDEVRSELAKALKREPDTLDECLDWLDEEGCLRDVDEVPTKRADRSPEDRLAWNGLKKAARKRLDQPDKPKRYVPYAVIQQKEVERALAISRDEALKLSRTPSVRRFRARRLSGQLLPDNQAKVLLEQLDQLSLPLSRRLQLGRFSDLNEGVIAEAGDAARYDVLERDDRFISASWDLPSDVFVSLPQLRRPQIRGRDQASPADQGLVDLNAALHKVATDISDRLGWTKGQAAWHLLTGLVPLHLPLHIQLLTTYRLGRVHTTITVVAEDWISHRTIDRAYRDAQQRLAAARRGRFANRRTGKRNLSVYQFVRQQEELRGLRPPFSELMEAWNAEHGSDFGPFTDPRRFWEAFKRVDKGLSGNLSQALRKRGNK